jgi:8-oxo-dGTP diphosphatase
MAKHEISASPDVPIPVAIALLLREPGEGTRSERDHTRSLPERKWSDPLILITKRLSHTPYGGYWEFPGGKMEPGESAGEAAERECLEELGVRVRVEAELPALEHRYEHAAVRLHACVGALVDPPEAIAHVGVSAHRWVRLGALPWMEFLPANVRLVTRLVRWMGVE